MRVVSGNPFHSEWRFHFLRKNKESEIQGIFLFFCVFSPNRVLLGIENVVLPFGC